MNYEKNTAVISVLLTALVLSFSIGLCISKKESFSENENRYLEPFPNFTFQDLKSGRYTKDMESYLADHFPFRDSFMNLKTRFELSLGKREINGVYIGKDGYLIEKYPTPSNTEKIISAFNRLEEALTEAEVSLMLVPTAVSVYADKLPAFAEDSRQMETLKEIYERVAFPAIDVYSILMQHKENEPLFYRLDHHWTSYGAYLAYQAYCENQGLTAVPLEALEKKVVTEDFKGTVYSKVNDYSLPGDAITIYEHPGQRLRVVYGDSGSVSDSLYEYSYLEKKDKYSFFLNNIHPFIEITNESYEGEDELVIIKDSYANCMVPFLTENFKKIYVVDPRYYKESVSEFINRNKKIKRILLLYNMNTMDSDLGIGGIY